jgi:hypothetical protein
VFNGKICPVFGNECGAVSGCCGETVREQRTSFAKSVEIKLRENQQFHFSRATVLEGDGREASGIAVGQLDVG